jgi:hypothetical protein
MKSFRVTSGVILLKLIYGMKQLTQQYDNWPELSLGLDDQESSNWIKDRHEKVRSAVL